MNEEHKNCKYRFKGKSCEDCPLNCKFKRLQEENIRLKKIKDDFFKQAEISHQAVQDKNKIIEKLETVIQEIKNLAELEGVLDENLKVFYPTNIQRILDEINEVLNDRDRKSKNKNNKL